MEISALVDFQKKFKSTFFGKIYQFRLAINLFKFFHLNIHENLDSHIDVVLFWTYSALLIYILYFKLCILHYSFKYSFKLCILHYSFIYSFKLCILHYSIIYYISNSVFCTIQLYIISNSVFCTIHLYFL